MANDISCNPLVLDTAAATVVVSNVFKIQSIVWVDSGNDMADGDQAILQNKAGKVIWERRLTTPGMIGDLQQTFPEPFPVNGLIVPTLTHGKVYVYWVHGAGAPKA